MDKRKAVLTLTEKLRKAGYVNLVIDPVVKDYLLSTAKHKVLDSVKGRIRTFYVSSIDTGDFTKEIVSHVPYSLEYLFPQANYFFLEGGSKSEYGDTWRNALVTPAALVGEIEERVLREKFYKNVPDEVVKSFEVLKIPNFIEAYQVYCSLKGDENLLGIYRPFKGEDKVETGDVIQGSLSKNYYLVDKTKSGGIEGYMFEDEALKIPVKEKKGIQRYATCDSSSIIPVKKRLSDTNFFEFVFSTPYEDRNIEANKVILKNLDKVDSCNILQKEYSEGKCFKDYFSVLSGDVQKKVVDSIKSLPKQDKFLNSWLFNQGFDVELDYLTLCKEDPENFISYFKSCQANIQELIVSDLFDCKEVSPKIIEFLDKEYHHLLCDVAFK